MENENNILKVKYYNWLCLICLTLYLATFLLAYKMAYIQGHLISSGIFVFPITFVIMDIMTEIYGRQAAKKFIKQAIVCEFIFAFLLFGLVQLPAQEINSTQESYRLVLGSVLRFCVSNVAGVVVGQYLNITILSRLRLLVKGRYFWLRSIGASLVGEFVTSLIADIGAFLGNYSWAEVWEIIFTIYVIKIIYAVILAYPAAYLVNTLQNKELHIYEAPLAKFSPISALKEIKGNNYA